MDERKFATAKVLKGLLDEGVINDIDFNREKGKLFSQLEYSVSSESNASADAGLDSDHADDMASGSAEDDLTAYFFVPAGMLVVRSMPALDRKLLKTRILFKWVAHGWQLRRVKKKLPWNDGGFNFKVYYGIDDRDASHCLSQERYVGGVVKGASENEVGQVADG
ncbi:hypothetical protein CYMTET_12993 [Cymbomonas tetramitiformis]|uniref:Uncharacterized protein n=1 Tax=Cymbomonas tetramitiformis TaxID=36881 RepID=A0AAE0BFZ6_9CHLO|nr:hypothetical protein CYMTET_54814 [Cymbomonas tetramitiformis]KAK3279108.1 hypothetical protein CYMTET_12993 [Cymbomonas tetramitiformis]